MIGHETFEAETIYNNDVYGWSLEQAKELHVFEPLLAESIWNLLKDNRQPVTDLGCGKGSYLNYLNEKGYVRPLIGYELTNEIDLIADHPFIYNGVNVAEPIECVDYGRGHVICLEVVEHLHKEDHAKVMQNIANFCADGCYLILSVARPLQGGTGHHSNLSSFEVLELVEPFGFEWLPRKSMEFRHNISPEASWFQDTLFVFQRKIN